MGKGTTITAKDISKAGDIPQLAKNLVADITTGNSEVRDHAAAQLRSLATQNHGQNQPDVLAAKAVEPLVKLLSSGTACSQESAAATLGVLALGKPDTQEAIVAAGGIGPLVNLLKMGSSKVQEQVASALAALDADVSHQQGIIKAGAIPPLVAIVKGGSGAAQSFAAQALANAAAYSCEAQRNIASAGSIPLLLSLLGTGKAQKPGRSPGERRLERTHGTLDVTCPPNMISPRSPTLDVTCPPNMISPRSPPHDRPHMIAPYDLPHMIAPYDRPHMIPPTCLYL